MRIEDIPLLSGPAPAGSLRIKRRVLEGSSMHAGRRMFLKGSLVTGGAIALWTLGFLPPARRALAAHGTQGYQIDDVCFGDYAGPCGDECGPTVTCNYETSYQCCIISNVHLQGFHKNDGGEFRLRPDQCVGSQSTPGTAWDGWKWEVGSCGSCATKARFRCHDGKRCTTTCNPDICKWRILCQ